MKLKIDGLNQDIIWKNKEENFQLIEQQLAESQADILLLPEMFATGFYMKPEEIADRNGETLTWMKNFAAKRKSAVAGSVSVEENGKFYNRFYFAEPGGAVHSYDKRHLFSYAGEHKTYTPGTERIIVPYKGWRILLQTCYDLRFPVFSRNKKDYDVALYVANWPSTRVDAWNTLLKARAIENQAFVFGVNRIGTDGNGLNYTESSYCFAADGKVISTNEENIVSAELDLNELRAFREKFPFLDDGDQFSIELN